MSFVVPTAVTAQRPRSQSSLTDNKAVVIVDAFTTGSCVAALAFERGFSIIHVLSIPPSENFDVESLMHGEHQFIWELEYVVIAGLNIEQQAKDIAKRLREDIVGRDDALELVAIIAGAETGVKLADLTSDFVVQGGWAKKVLTNGGSGV
jgi:hypothetical protein